MFSGKVKMYRIVSFVILTLCLLFVAPSSFGKTPVDFKKWQIDDTTFSKQIGGSVRNYEKPDKAWAQIVNDFQIEGDSVVYVDQSVLRSRVNKNGVCKVMLTWNDAEYTITQKLLGIGWLKISTRQSLWIDSTMDWSNFSVDSNIAKWTGVSPAVDYRVLKDNGRVAHGIFFKPAFLDSAVTLYDQRADSLDIALANVMVYTLSSNIDNADSAIGDVPKRRLKDFGYYTFNLRDQQLRFPGSDTLPRIPVRQYWERRGTKIIYIEYVMMRRVKQVHEAYPSATIWHNDSKTIDGTTNVDDTYLDGSLGDDDENRGVNWSLSVFPSIPTRTLIRVKNVASELGAGATISAAVCSLKNGPGSTAGDIFFYRVFKPWEEGIQDGVVCESPGCSWNDWACTDFEWATAGCDNADDGGSDNSGDGAGADRKATAEDTHTIGTSSQTWHDLNITTALAQGWYDETINEEGIIIISDGTASIGFRSTEYITSADRPFWVFTYTTPGIFGYNTVGVSWSIFNDYVVYVIPVRLSPPQGGAIRIDSVLVYAKKAIAPITGGYLKGVVYNYNPVTAECSLQVVSDDSVWVDSDTPQWWNLPMPSDTLRACRDYMVGFQVKNHDGAAQMRIYYDEGSVGDIWFVGDSDFDPPTTLSGADESYESLFSVMAYYTVVSTDTLVVVNSMGADSADWYDSYIYSGGPTANFGTGLWMQHGVTSGDDFYTFTKYTSMSNIIPSGKKCDSAWLAFKIFSIEGASKTDSLWFDVRRVIPYWTEADVTWNKRLFIGDWTTPGALSEGNDILATPEQADNVCRCVRQVGWSLMWDSVMCNVDDTLLFQLDPNTLDSMSSGDLSSYGWKIQFDLTRSSDVSQRVFTRNRSPFADRPYMYIYCSDIPAVAGGGQFMIISEGR